MTLPKKQLTLQCCACRRALRRAWEKAGDSRGEGKVLRVLIYTPPAFKVLKITAFL